MMSGIARGAEGWNAGEADFIRKRACLLFDPPLADKKAGFFSAFSPVPAPGPLFFLKEKRQQPTIIRYLLIQIIG
jgi:hypothetical protein